MEYQLAGGKLLFIGAAVLQLTGNWNWGAQVGSLNQMTPTYLMPEPDFCPEFVSTPFVMYGQCLELQRSAGVSTGTVYEPYFNRDLHHFCSHRQTPSRPEPSSFIGGVINGNLALLAHPVFTNYADTGAVVLRQYVTRIIEHLLGSDITLRTNLPSTARTTVTHDRQHRRYIVHLLYGNIVKRGEYTELIEELLPLHHINFTLKVPESVTRVSLEPQGIGLPFETSDGKIHVNIAEFTCHQMICVEY